ncbi:MAG TPA: hypothetical protein VJZ31_01670 [Bacilli bacterium]|nr:hypothetical protein [Bacilli bacterium]
MPNMLISLQEIAVIIGLVLFFALVIFLEIRRKKAGKSHCASSSTCSVKGQGCDGCNIKQMIKDSKKDGQ